MSTAIHPHTEAGPPVPEESLTAMSDPEQQRRLEFQWERTAHLLRDMLSQRLRADVELRFRSQQTCPFDQFVRELEVPTGMLRFRGGPPDFPFLLDPGPRLFFPMLDRLLGGRPTPTPQRRPLTQLDRRVAMQLGTWIADTIAEAWNEPQLHVAEPLGVECDPQQIRIVPADELVLIVGFDARFDGIPGLIRLCLPLSALWHETEPPDTEHDSTGNPPDGFLQTSLPTNTSAETSLVPPATSVPSGSLESIPTPEPQRSTTPTTGTPHADLAKRSTLELRLTLPLITLAANTTLAVGDLLPLTPLPGESFLSVTIDGESVYGAQPADNVTSDTTSSDGNGGYHVHLRPPRPQGPCPTDCNSG